jgi:hypothetical protein
MKKGAVIVAAGLTAVFCRAADPYVGYLYPAGMQAGTTNCLIIGGHNLRSLQGLWFGCDGIRVLKLEQKPNFSPPTGSYKRHLTKWLNGIANGRTAEPERPTGIDVTEWRTNRWWTALDRLTPLQRSLVERYLFTPRDPAQEGPSIRMVTLATVAVDRDVKPGRYDLFAWDGKGISAPRPFVVTAERHVAEPLFVPSHRQQPPPPQVESVEEGVVLDGQIFPGTTDAFRLPLTGRRSYAIQVRARELQPYVGDAVPGFFNPQVILEDAAGRVVARGDDAQRFRPDPALEFTPQTDGVYTLRIRDVLYRGRADFVYAVTVTPREEKPKRLRDKDEIRQEGTCQTFRGVIEKPGAVKTCSFTVVEPGPRVFTLTARRQGAPLDAVMTLRREHDPVPLARWDDVTNTVFIGTIPQAECDPKGRYDFKEAGRYTLEIADRTGHGGAAYFWELEIRPPRPDFRVYSTRSTLPFMRGRPLTVDFVIQREDGFDGTVTLTFPPGVTARNHVATSGVERLSAVLTYGGTKPQKIQAVRLEAYARIDGTRVTRDVVPCDEQEQAFAWKHLVPTERFLMRATPRKKKKDR